MTSGSIVAIGTTLPEINTILYSMYKNKQVKKRIFYNWEQIYDFIKVRNQEEADKYSLRPMSEIKEYGLQNEYIQTQYYCSFDVNGVRFMTEEKLHKIATTEYGLTNIEIDSISNNTEQFIIGSFDSARYNDYAVFSVGFCYKLDDKWNVELRDFKILNPDKILLSPDDLSTKLQQLCAEYKVDLLIYDATANQTDRVYYLWKELQRTNTGTLVVPFDYSGGNKIRMFTYLEDCFASSQFKMPSLRYKDQNPFYKEAVDELLYFTKTVSGSGLLQFKAPEGDFHDDCVNAIAMLNYLPYVLEKWMDSYKTANLSLEADYRLTFSKFNFTSSTEQTRRKNWR